jgi:hypothetical protein
VSRFHRGAHYTVDGIQFLHRPVQQPGVPVWTAGYPINVKPLRRAAGRVGFFPVDLDHPDQLVEIVTTITGLRRHPFAPYYIAVGLQPGTDPAAWTEAGATWWLPEFYLDTLSLDQVRGVASDGAGDTVSHDRYPRSV